MPTWFVWLTASTVATLAVFGIGLDLWRTKHPSQRANAPQNGTQIPQGTNSPASGVAHPGIDSGWHPSGQHHNSYEREYWNRSLIISGIVAVGAGVSAWFAIDTANEARIANQMNAESGRAWIAPATTALNKELSNDKPIDTTLNYINSGKEPAIHVKGAGLTILVPYLDNAHLTDWNNPVINACNYIDTKENGAISFPGAITYNMTWDIGRNIIFSLNPETNDVTQGNPGEDPPALLSEHKASLMLSACITYETVQRPRYTIVCLLMFPNPDKPSTTWEFRSCRNGNDAS